MNYLINNLLLSLKYSIFFVMILLFFGIIFTFIEKRNSLSIHSVSGRRGLIITGMIGTIIHELSHIIMCLIFRHEITDFALFRPYKSRYDGIMGYVNHSCNKKSIYQITGNFFIGISPIIFGTLFLILSMYIFLPSKFEILTDLYARNMVYLANINNIHDSINVLINIIITIIFNILPIKQESTIMYLIYIYIMYSVTTHMDLSKEDIKNSKSGFLFFFLLVFIFNIIMISLGGIYKIFMIKTVVSIFAFLLVGILFSVLTMIISMLVEFLLS